MSTEDGSLCVSLVEGQSFWSNGCHCSTIASTSRRPSLPIEKQTNEPSCMRRRIVLETGWHGDKKSKARRRMTLRIADDPTEFRACIHQAFRVEACVWPEQTWRATANDVAIADIPSSSWEWPTKNAARRFIAVLLRVSSRGWQKIEPIELRNCSEAAWLQMANSSKCDYFGENEFLRLVEGMRRMHYVSQATTYMHCGRCDGSTRCPPSNCPAAHSY